MPQIHPTHLGDGAYMSLDFVTGDLAVTANHHLVREATDVVVIPREAIPAIIAWLSEVTEQSSRLT